MEAVMQIYLLLICQGLYLGSVGQQWMLPHEVVALLGSCVEIPCTYDPPRISDTPGTVWYLYNRYYYQEILNTKDSSSVMEEYKDRTSLVPGPKSCTLRIDPVRRRDNDTYYYPGIPGDRAINAYEKYSRPVLLQVTDTVNIWLHFPKAMTEGEATIIRCRADHTCGSSPPSLQWNKPSQNNKHSSGFVFAFWREESELTYIPSYEDDGTPIQCTATYPNGRIFTQSGTLNIKYPPKDVTVRIIGMDKVMEGGNVTLQCSSFSKPDVYEYEWYKGKSKLPDTGPEITVRKVTRGMEPYSCTAINLIGRGTSALMEIPVSYATVNSTMASQQLDGGLWSDMEEVNVSIPGDEESKNIKHIILLATTGIICLLLLVLLVFACSSFHRKRQKKLAKTESSYTDLRISDITSIYDQLKTEVPTDTAVVGSDVYVAHEYANAQK